MTQGWYGRNLFKQIKFQLLIIFNSYNPRSGFFSSWQYFHFPVDFSYILFIYHFLSLLNIRGRTTFFLLYFFSFFAIINLSFFLSFILN